MLVTIRDVSPHHPRGTDHESLSASNKKLARIPLGQRLVRVSCFAHTHDAAMEALDGVLILTVLLRIERQAKL